ncbi:MAG: hypothetical protein JWO85_2239 [Candidatus Eremiobacteraeota bacterium]|nr:hypothetical protein [Candidatus Eremiobacteraeota bacterium]
MSLADEILAGSASQAAVPPTRSLADRLATPPPAAGHRSLADRIVAGGATHSTKIELAVGLDGKPKRENPLRQIADTLAAVPAFGAAAVDDLNAAIPWGRERFQAEQRADGYVPDKHALKHAVELLRTKGPAAVTDYFDAFGTASTLRHHPGKPLPPAWLQAAGEFGEQWENPANIVVGKGLGLVGKGVGIARRAVPFVDDTANIVEGLTTKPLGRAVNAVEGVAKKVVGKAAGAASYALGPIGAAGRSFFSSYAPLRERGGTPFVAGGITARSAPESAKAQIATDTRRIGFGLTREQKIEVQKLAYRDSAGAQMHARSQAVPDPAKGPSLQERAADMRQTLMQDDVLLDARGLKSVEKGEQKATGIYFPMRPFGKRPVFQDPVIEKIALEQGEAAAVAAVRASSRRRSARSAGLTKPGHALHDTILDPEVEAALHPEYDPMHQYQEHRMESARALANEETNLAREQIPSLDPKTGEQRWWIPPGATEPEPIYARMDPAWVKPGGRTGPDIPLGRGEEGAKELQRYINSAVGLKATAKARQDPNVLRIAQERGVDPRQLGTRAVIERNMAPFDARKAEAGQASRTIANTAGRVGADVQRSSTARALEIARISAGLDKAKQSLLLGNDVLGNALRENKTVRDALSSTVVSEREAARGILEDMQRLRGVRGEAGAMHEAEAAAQQPFWDALSQVGGKIKPDLVWDATKKRWTVAGEFIETPKALLTPTRGIVPPISAQGRAPGNIDQITAIVRKTHPEITDSEVRDFFNANPRPPKPADFMADAHDRVMADALTQFSGRGADAAVELRAALKAARGRVKMAQGAASAAGQASRPLASAAAQMGKTVDVAGAGIDRAAGRLGNVQNGEPAALERIGALDRKQRVRLEALRQKAEQVRAQGEAAAAFKAARDQYARELYAEVKQSVEKDAMQVPSFGNEAPKNLQGKPAYERETDVGLASPSGKYKVLDKSFAEFDRGSQRLTPRETEDAKLFWNTMQTLNRFARAMIVLTPQVHAINNEGMAFLATGGDVGRMAQILAGKAKFSPELEARALKAGWINEYAQRTMGGALGEGGAHFATTETNELAGEIAKKLTRNTGDTLGPIGRAVKPLAAAGIRAERGFQIPERIGARAEIPGTAPREEAFTSPLGTTKVSIGGEPAVPAKPGVRVPLVGGMNLGYQPMNEWLFHQVERGYAMDLGERLTAQGMSDGEAAIEIRNTFGKYGDISAREMAWNLDRLFYFLPWMKTVIPFWVKQGMIDPKWWSAPVRAIQVNNEAQGFDDPSRPFTGTFGHRKDGSFRRITVAAPQRVLENVAEAVRVPFDVLSGLRGDPAWAQNAREDAAAPGNYIGGHASLPLSVLLDAYQSIQGGGRTHLAPYNTFYTDPHSTAWQQALGIAGKIGAKMAAPLGVAQRLPDDPLGVAGTYLTGGFAYGAMPKALRDQHKAIRTYFAPMLKATRAGIDQAHAAGNAAREAQLRATLQRIEAAEREQLANPLPVAK